ncbi:MAG: hypothetical protein VX252_13660 [Myxococcota bacterium]|nr:hypothetical protein [Myxococcota bacterium]
MRPETPPSWSGKHLSAPIVALFRGPNYMYGERSFRVETTPASGYLDIFYVRSGFQKKFEQAESPAIVIVPPRVETGPRDALTIRAFAEGYEQSSITIDVDGRLKDLVIDLEPLPNTLEAVDYRYFAGRSTFTFMTREALTFRVQDSDTGYSVILNQTAVGPEALRVIERIYGPRIAEAYHQQLGDDLMVGLVLRENARNVEMDLRSRQSYDAPRDLHVFEIDLVEVGSSANSVERALVALQAVRPSDVSGCAAVFDSSLRSQLDPGSLSRALRPRGAFSDRYLRAAMRRLGEVSLDRVVYFEDGTQLRVEGPLELELAISNASVAKGYLALLRSFVNRNEVDAMSRQQALRSLLAPDLGIDEFETRLGVAEAAEAACRKGGGR